MMASRRSPAQISGIPAWLALGLAVVTAISIYALFAERYTAAVVATALATVLLALFTAQLYSTAVAQLRASVRPLLVEVKPFAAPPADLGGHYEEESGRHGYNLRFPDGYGIEDWDGRRPYVYSKAGEPLRVSVVIRNVGQGLALIADQEINLADEGVSTLSYRKVRYPRLPPGESTRVNVVCEARRNNQQAPLTVKIPYTDLSGVHREVAKVRLEYQPSKSRTRDDTGHAWYVSDVAYGPY